MVRTIKIENKKLFNLLTEKGDLINTGREISDKVESYEKEMEELDLKVQEAEKKVDITDLTDKEKEISDRVQKCIDDMNAVKQEIYKRMSEQVDHSLHEAYEEVKKKKEQAEEIRNKIAIKIQKYNDKIIPLSRTLMKPFIEDEYEDYETIKIEDGKIVATIFSHLDDFKNNFKKK